MGLGRKVYKVAKEFLAYQDKMIDTAYTRPFLKQNVNPFIRKGVKMGARGGQIFSGFYRGNQYIDNITEMDSGTNVSQAPTSYGRFGKTRNRYTRRSKHCFNYNKYPRRYRR